MAFWRTEDPDIVVDEKTGRPRVTRGGMWSFQRRFWQLPNFVKILVTGYGGGKTVTLCKRAIAVALHNAPVPSLIISPTFPQARRTVIPTMTSLLTGKSQLRPDMRWRHNKGEHVFEIQVECRPPAYVHYASGDNPDALKGQNIGWAGIDEPFIQDVGVFEQAVARVRDPSARHLEIALGGTPEQLNWGYELAEGELRGRYDVGYVNADTRENKALDPSYAARMIKGFDPKAAEAYVGGKFVSLSTGRVFYAFDRARNVVEAKPEGTHFWCTDFNVDPMAFAVGWYRGDRVHIYAEYELPNADTEYAASVVREKHHEVRICFPDPTGKQRSTNAPAGMSDFKWIQRAGFIVLAPNEPWPRRDSYNSVNRKLADGSMTVDPSCKRLVRYMTEHSHELMAKQEAMTHLLDAVRYGVTYLFPAFRTTSGATKIVGA